GSGRRPVVDIRVDLETLVGLAERAGEIPGWGPVIADIARRLVEQQPDGEWRGVVTDPDTGAVLADGTTRRRPTAAQRRYLQAPPDDMLQPAVSNAGASFRHRPQPSVGPGRGHRSREPGPGLPPRPHA